MSQEYNQRAQGKNISVQLNHNRAKTFDTFSQI